MLRRLFGHRREEVVGGWRRLHNEELHNLHTASKVLHVIISRTTRWAGRVARMGGMKNAYSILVGKPDWKR
jgi:hypothetical protein